MTPSMNVVVTGGTGFIARRLIRLLMIKGHKVTATTRSSHPSGLAIEPGIRYAHVGPLNASTDWKDALDQADVVVHLAGRAHVMRENLDTANRENALINLAGTVRLGEEVINAGAQRLIFVSTAKVFGEGSRPGEPFTPDDRPAPVGPYATSKALAEARLREIFSGTSAELGIVRPPLVYGGEAKGNFRRLTQLANSPIPIPLSNATNRRSMVYIDNLASFLAKAVQAPDVDGRILLPADSAPYTIGELLAELRAAFGRPTRLFGMPAPLARLLDSFSAHQPILRRLLGNFEISTSESNAVLGWQPPIDFSTAIRMTAREFTS